VVLKGKYNTYKKHRIRYYITCGLVIGTIASYLSIGGGPMNILLLSLFFSLDTKRASFYSVVLILVTTGFSLIIDIAMPGQLTAMYNLKPLLYLIPTAMLAGFIGATIGKRLSLKVIDRGLNALLCTMLALNIINILTVI
jgi:uncharacterized protein